jgi:cytochrome c oxidase subunit III
MSVTMNSPVVLPPRGSGQAKASQSGIWVAMFAITMSFAAFTSALVIRQASADWTHLRIPRILFVNTALLLFSSVLLEMSRRAMLKKSEAAAQQIGRSKILLSSALILGLMFIVGQYVAWQQLAAQGLFLATNPNSSFFYLLTGMHILHLVGGIIALAYLLVHRALSGAVRPNLVNGVVTYWHFMAALWIYLLFIIITRL